jgi:deoxycytidylate deaminase
LTIAGEDEKRFNLLMCFHAEANAILKVAGSTQSCQVQHCILPFRLAKIAATYSSICIKRVVYQKGTATIQALYNFNKSGC